MSDSSTDAGNGASQEQVPEIVAWDIRPLGDRILVEQCAPDTHVRHGELKLEVPDKDRKKPLRGIVRAIGPAVEKGRFRTGSLVLFGQFSGTEIPEEYGERLRMLRQDEVMADLFPVMEIPALPLPPTASDS